MFLAIKHHARRLFLSREFNHGHLNFSDEFRDGRQSTSVNNKYIDAMHRMIETDRHVTYHDIWASLDQCRLDRLKLTLLIAARMKGRGASEPVRRSRTSPLHNIDCGRVPRRHAAAARCGRGSSARFCRDHVLGKASAGQTAPSRRLAPAAARRRPAMADPPGADPPRRPPRADGRAREGSRAASTRDRGGTTDGNP
ncbi:hypothetical protein EVAR_7844_1 [Eumeta japonica]|uniref:Uncharacterized protein n=1 Tax=Eumeta variegata TaxID=151549 RepID=A0A4C1TUY8_EUMVA|nr:hypothetical protein EVAR_7844_1 [Eumeta japonica]